MAETNSITIPLRVKDLTGQRFGRLLVLTYAGKGPSGRTHWLCRCDCGTEYHVISRSLLTGHTKSCGCLANELTRIRSTTHGMRHSPEYGIWCDVIKRCSNPNYDYYAKRGITVCWRWRNSFATFIEDMGARPSAKHSIERIDNDGNYEPGNVRWATPKEQARNRRNNRLLTHEGKIQCMASWAEVLGIDYRLLCRRLNLGWRTERALTEPVHHRIRPHGTVSATMDS